MASTQPRKSTDNIMVMAEAKAMEDFLTSKKIPGKNMAEKVDNYCKEYKVPSDIKTLMHDIRQNGNKDRHSDITKPMKALEYHSDKMRLYQGYYDKAKGKSPKDRTYIVSTSGTVARKKDAKKPAAAPSSPSTQKPSAAAPSASKPSQPSAKPVAAPSAQKKPATPPASSSSAKPKK